MKDRRWLEFDLQPASDYQNPTGHLKECWVYQLNIAWVHLK